jgi:hypothetical protein
MKSVSRPGFSAASSAAVLAVFIGFLRAELVFRNDRHSRYHARMIAASPDHGLKKTMLGRGAAASQVIATAIL